MRVEISISCNVTRKLNRTGDEVKEASPLGTDQVALFEANEHRSFTKLIEERSLSELCRSRDVQL